MGIWRSASGSDIRWYNCAAMESIRSDIDMALIKVKGRMKFPIVLLRTPDEPVSESGSDVIIGYLFDANRNRLRPNHFDGRVSSAGN